MIVVVGQNPQKNILSWDFLILFQFTRTCMMPWWRDKKNKDRESLDKKEEKKLGQCRDLKKRLIAMALKHI